MSDVVIFYRVSPEIEIGRVTVTSSGAANAEGVGHVYLNSWRKNDKDTVDFIDYYSNWSNGKVKSITKKANVSSSAD